MSETPVMDSLKDHLARTWGMLREAIGNFPEETWSDSEDQRMSPARIGYHILMGAERYCWRRSADDYVAKRRFNLNWETAPAEELPSKSEMLEYFQAAEAMAIDWLDGYGETGLIDSEPIWPWTGDCALGQAIYELRHLQHHLAELNLELRRRGLRRVAWQ